jgi:hypothetical protein
VNVLFTADWHIKLGAKNIPTEWAKNRYRILFENIKERSKVADLVIIGGDVFDRMPSLDELQLFFDFVSEYCPKETIIYSGNHEAVRKNTTFLSNLKDVVKRLNSNVSIIDSFVTIHGIDFIPYNCLKEYHPQDIDFHSDILCTHVRGEIPPHVKPEVPLSLFERWKIVLAGDLHAYENSQLNILYPGSPLTTSFHRNLTSTGIILLNTDTLEHTWIELNVPQLIKKTISAGEPTPPTEFHHTIYEVEGNLTELATLESSELIGKKITKRAVDTTLILDSQMSMEEEVVEYLTFILELDNETVEKAIKMFKDNYR